MPLLSIRREPGDLTIDTLVPWEKGTRVPRGVAAVLAALRFSQDSREAVQALSDAEWKQALAFTDLAGLTLLLGATCHDYLPGWVEERIGRNLAGNTERLRFLRGLLAEISNCFDAAGVEYLVLKGFSQQAEYVADPGLRMAFDIDLFAPPDSLAPALEALLSLGYEKLEGTEKLPTDHLPPLIRKTGWRWHGDFFDPDIPGVVDLHFQFWDPATERFEAPGVEEFWSRRRKPQTGLPVLHPVDRLGYAALHSLRHLLRGSVRVSQVYEIAYFLDSQADEDSFWNAWLKFHPEPLRRLEAVTFCLAARWFACRVPEAVRDATEAAGPDVQLWFERYSASPVEAQFHPNKDEIWLHFGLLERTEDRRRVFLRRMLPATLPVPIGDVFVPDGQRTWGSRMRAAAGYAGHIVRRTVHHARVVPVTVLHGLAWKWRALRLEGPFWRFLLLSSLFNVGLCLFYLLYNLYLLDRGYRENVLGRIVGAFTAGGLAGVLPAAALAHRLGLKRTLSLCFAGTATVFLARAFAGGQPALIASAFAGGVFFGIWAVCLPPVVAALTTERNRPTAFSLIFGTGIGVGVLIGVLGGHLPGWAARAGVVTGTVPAMRLALVIASVLVALALIPLARLPLASPRSRMAGQYPSGPFIRRFLLAIGFWYLATGALNPLFNAYFSRQFGMPVERIGAVLSLSQLGQVVAILLAPVVIRRLGLVRGVAAMQLATALTLFVLAVGPAASPAVAIFAAYLSLQYMSEPGICSLLMNNVPPEQSSGASALNFLVLFSTQAAAAWLGGAAAAHYGYPAMLAGAGAIATVAGVTWWYLLRALTQTPLRRPD